MGKSATTKRGLTNGHGRSLCPFKPSAILSRARSFARGIPSWAT